MGLLRIQAHFMAGSITPVSMCDNPCDKRPCFLFDSRCHLLTLTQQVPNVAVTYFSCPNACKTKKAVWLCETILGCHYKQFLICITHVRIVTKASMLILCKHIQAITITPQLI